MTTQIEPERLHRLIEEDAVKVIDGSWALDGTDMHALYFQDHIPGAQFFDIDAISDRSTSLPHMAPSPETFAAAVGAMGISERDPVVVYDRQGLFSAARVWWTFTLMGHKNVQVLRGGLAAWTAAGMPLENRVSTPAIVRYQPELQNDKIISLNTLRSFLDSFIVLDARARARFEGLMPEPRPGLRSGHMPGARNLPYTALIQDGALRPREELEKILGDAGVKRGLPVVTTCGSGVTAAIISMALGEIGHHPALLYDGSWAEWGQADLDTPVVTGPAG